MSSEEKEDELRRQLQLGIGKTFGAFPELMKQMRDQMPSNLITLDIRATPEDAIEILHFLIELKKRKEPTNA